MKEDIAKHKATLQKAENAGQKLIASSKNNPAVVADIYGKLNKVRGALDTLAAKVDQRQNRLQNVLMQSQEFQVSFEDFLEKLGRVEDQVEQLDPVSGIHENAKEQGQEHKVDHAVVSLLLLNFYSGCCNVEQPERDVKLNVSEIVNEIQIFIS